MPKQPKLGTEWSQLWDIVAKLSGDAVLDSSERWWLAKLLTELARGEDVTSRFTKNSKPSPKADLHFWIACDVAQHLHEKKRPARELVAKRWRLTDSGGQPDPDAVKLICNRQRKNVEPISHMLGPWFAIVIEGHRIRLLKGS